MLKRLNGGNKYIGDDKYENIFNSFDPCLFTYAILREKGGVHG